MEIVAHIIILVFASYVILSANPGSSQFSWHPTCMVIAWSLLTEGVILFRKPSPGWRVPVHWAFQATGVSMAIYGFLAIYRNKENSLKPHFTTYHGLMGGLTMGLLTATAINGNIAKYSPQLAGSFPGVKPSFIKWAHRAIGSLALIAISTTVCLALSSLWFQAVTGESKAILYGAGAAVFYPVGYILKNKYF